MTGNRHGGQDKPPGRHLCAVDKPEPTEEERRVALARIVYLQALAALLENDPDAQEFLMEQFTVTEETAR